MYHSQKRDAYPVWIFICWGKWVCTRTLPFLQTNTSICEWRFHTWIGLTYIHVYLFNQCRYLRQLTSRNSFKVPDLKPQAQRRGVKHILRIRHITEKLTMLYTRQYTIYSLTLIWIYIHNALIATAQEMTIAQHKFLRLGAQKRLKERVSI